MVMFAVTVMITMTVIGGCDGDVDDGGTAVKY